MRLYVCVVGTLCFRCVSIMVPLRLRCGYVVLALMLRCVVLCLRCARAVLTMCWCCVCAALVLRVFCAVLVCLIGHTRRSVLTMYDPFLTVVLLAAGLLFRRLLFLGWGVSALEGALGLHAHLRSAHYLNTFECMWRSMLNVV